MPDAIQKGSRKHIVICLLLAVSTVAVYGQVVHHDFVNYDDPLYITKNPTVQAGLTWEGVCWAFTTGHASNWHPVTWLSHMVDVSMFGLDPMGHHLTNLILHLANTLFLFYLLHRMTGALWRSALVAALFSLHPLHVESVAWVSERKDVLSTFFWFTTLWAYLRFVEKKTQARYGMIVVSFALGLMAKPMLVTLPFTLVLLDYWPLGRIGSEPGRGGDLIRNIVRLVTEKWALFILSGASCVVTFLVQQHGPAVQSLEQIPLGLRVTNAVVAYAAYLVKTLWPARLAVYYPHPMDNLPPAFAGTALVVLVLVTAFFVIRRKRYPFGVVGWLWFLGTLVPVIGIVQVGGQAMADRYTYVPLTGIFLTAVWGIGVFVGKRPSWRKAAVVGVSLVVTALGITSWRQVGHWRTSISIFEHAVAATKDNQLAHNQLGSALLDDGKVDEGIGHLREAIGITPQYVTAHVGLGNALREKGDFYGAMEQYREALRFDPNHLTAKNNLATILAMEGQSEEALALFLEVLQRDPRDAKAQNNLGILMAKQGRFNEAVGHFEEALRLDPGSVSARKNLQQALEQRDRK